MDAQKVDYDGLCKSLGSFGKYQKFVFVMASFASLIAGALVSLIAMIAYPMKSRCVISGCDRDDSVYSEPFLNFTTPWNEEKQIWDQCHHFKRIVDTENNSCFSEVFSEKNVTCNAWIYDKSLFTATLVSDFDLTCDKAAIIPLAGSLYMFGMLIGSLGIGELADRYGRVTAVVFCGLLAAISGILTAVSPFYSMVLIMRFITGIAGVGLFQTAFVISVEFIGSDWRTFCGILIDVPFALGGAFTAAVSYLLREWRYQQVAVATPAIIIVAFKWFLMEPVRWLAVRGRINEAQKVIERTAAVNRLPVPLHLQTLISTISDSGDVTSRSHSIEAAAKKRNVMQLLHRPIMRKRTFKLLFIWLSINLAYYGLSLNSVNIGKNIFSSFILSMVIEVPAYLSVLLFLTRLGRKGVLASALFLAGVFCCLSGLVPRKLHWLIIAFSLVGKFGAAAAFGLIFVYTAEIYSTEYRSLGVGACSMCGRIGAVIAPFIANLGLFHEALPFLAFGGLTVLSGFFILMLPETAGLDLPQTVDEAEVLAV